MTIQDDQNQDQPRIRRSWQERLVVPALVAGVLLTLSWIVVLAAAALQIVSAIAEAGPHG
jgi:hypothetical protein